MIIVAAVKCHINVKPNGEHVVSSDNEPKDADGNQGVDHAQVAEDLLLPEKLGMICRQSPDRKDEDVNLWMSKNQKRCWKGSGRPPAGSKKAVLKFRSVGAW